MTQVAETNLQQLEALEAQANQINAQVEAVKKAAYDEAVATIKSLMTKFNIQHMSLGKKANKKATGPVKAKFTNPVGNETWTGRGKQPAWFKAAIEEGYDAKDLLIDKPAQDPAAE